MTEMSYYCLNNIGNMKANIGKRYTADWVVFLMFFVRRNFSHWLFGFGQAKLPFLNRLNQYCSS